MHFKDTYDRAMAKTDDPWFEYLLDHILIVREFALVIADEYEKLRVPVNQAVLMTAVELHDIGLLLSEDTENHAIVSEQETRRFLYEERGAQKVYVGGTHGVLTSQAVERLVEAPIEEIVVTNTIPLNSYTEKIGKVKVLSVAAMLGEAIKRIHRNESVSSLFTNI